MTSSHLALELWLGSGACRLSGGRDDRLNFLFLGKTGSSTLMKNKESDAKLALRSRWDVTEVQMEAAVSEHGRRDSVSMQKSFIGC